MKKSRTVMTVMLVANALMVVCFPYLLLFFVFATEQIVYMPIIALMLFLVLGTAVTASVMAGYSVKTRWYAAVLPPVIIQICSMLYLGGYWGSDDFWIVFAGTIVFWAVCVVTMLLTEKLHAKKLAAQDTQTCETEKVNNETI